MPWVERSGADSWRVRYRRDDGDIGSISGFPSEQAANDFCDDLKSDQRRGQWSDPAAGQITLGEWVPDWLDALDVDKRTEDNKRSILRNHILPRWGDTALKDITHLKAHAWAKSLRDKGLAPATVAGVVKQLSTMLADAADEKLILANPIRPRRRGRRRHSTRTAEKVWAEPAEVVRFADQVARFYHPSGALLVITAAWTGARWGELTGLQRPNLTLHDDDTGHITIDPDIGTLHEDDNGRFWLGPPKTDASVRTIPLPRFLVPLLRAHLGTHHHAHVFPTPSLDLYRRSNFSRRAVRPCADGNLHIAKPAIRLEPTKPGLTFHGLRHSHKTWMIDDGIPEIAQALRLGHVLENKVQQTYSHVARAVESRLLDALDDRWHKAIIDAAATDEMAAWRQP
jgi:integrase